MSPLRALLAGVASGHGDELERLHCREDGVAGGDAPSTVALDFVHGVRHGTLLSSFPVLHMVSRFPRLIQLGRGAREFTLRRASRSNRADLLSPHDLVWAKDRFYCPLTGALTRLHPRTDGGIGGLGMAGALGVGGIRPVHDGRCIDDLCVDGGCRPQFIVSGQRGKAFPAFHPPSGRRRTRRAS